MRRIEVVVRPKSSQEKVEKTSDGKFKVWVRDATEHGKANEAVRTVLADYFNVSKSVIRIVRGIAQTQKIIELP